MGAQYSYTNFILIRKEFIFLFIHTNYQTMKKNENKPKGADENIPAKTSADDINVETTNDEVSVNDRLKEAIAKAPDDVIKTKTQQNLLERELKRQMGLLHKGRPIDMSSTRQQRLAELDEKRERGELKPGRPKYTEAERKQADLVKKQKAKEELKVIQELAKTMIEKQKVPEGMEQ